MEMTKASFLTESLNRSNIKDTQKEIFSGIQTLKSGRCLVEII